MNILKALTGPVFYVSGSLSQNTPGWITLGKDETYLLATLAQERFEQAWYRLAMIFIGLPAAGLFYWMWPGLWMIALVLIPLSAALTQIVKPFHQWQEISGTALDIAIAVRYHGADLESYENRKVHSRVRYPQFRKWSIDMMKAAFVAARAKANERAPAWVE